MDLAELPLLFLEFDTRVLDPLGSIHWCRLADCTGALSAFTRRGSAGLPEEI